MGIKFYRVEKANGDGPYQNTNHGMTYDLPDAYHDPLVPTEFVVKTEHRFGCANKRLMRQWVVDAEALKAKGFRVREYKIKSKQKVVRGLYQSISVLSNLEVLREHDIVQFVKGKINA